MYTALRNIPLRFQRHSQTTVRLHSQGEAGEDDIVVGRGLRAVDILQASMEEQIFVAGEPHYGAVSGELRGVELRSRR